MLCPQDNDSPQHSLVPSDNTAVDSLGSEEAAFWLLISELEGSDLREQSEFGALPEAVRKKKKQKLNSEEALPSVEANSGFINITVQRLDVPHKQTVSSRDMAVGISSSAAFMLPLDLSIITSQQCIVLAVRLCAALSVWHTGCDPPLRDLY